MRRLFLVIYHSLRRSKALFVTLLVATTLLLLFGALNIRLDENLTSFFPKSDDATREFVMNNMKAKDKIVIVISHTDTLKKDIYTLTDAAESYNDSLTAKLDTTITTALYFEDESSAKLFGYVFDNMPFVLTDDIYTSLDKATSDSAIAAQMATNKELMFSPLSSGLRYILPSDPLGLSAPILMKLKDLGNESALSMVDGYMMDSEQNNLILFVNLPSDFSETGDNETLVNTIRQTATSIEEQFGVRIYIYGAPIVAVSNSTQVKKDEVFTLSLAIIVTAIVVWLTFRRKRTIFLILLPVVFGGLFACAIIGLLGIELSLIAIGAGATVLGVAMSYSIHMVTHSLHSESIEQLIDDMAYPMTIGSITTIGAFVGLTFTQSKILHDLGLFASLALVGTLIFCLIFLPHFLTADATKKKSRTLRFIEKIAGYDYSRNKWVVGGLVVLTLICLFRFTDVSFDADMTKLNYQGDEFIEESRMMMEDVLQVNGHRSTVVVTGSNMSELSHNAHALANKASEMSDEGLTSFTSLTPYFLIPDSIQRLRLDKWNTFWSPERKEQVISSIERHASANGFTSDSFKDFISIISREYSITQPTEEEIQTSPLLNEWITKRDSVYMMYFNIVTEVDRRDAIMQELSTSSDVVATDMGYFVRQATSGIVDDFNTILVVSSLLVGFVLLLSYGRFELFVMTFLPMCISWVIILGLMAICGVEFNVVNIILSTFIFGVGDDFSIFIMDGLQSEYKTGKKILSSHKTAIALSAFAVIVGLGAQIFAQHPAVHSIGLLSIFGMIAVIVTSYIVQPVLFRLFISAPAKKGSPFTVLSLLRSLMFYITFIIGCIVSNTLLMLLIIMPISKRTKQRFIRTFVWLFMKLFYKFICTVFKFIRIGTVDFSRPSVIIANHVSFIDIIAMMALSPRLVFVTKTWVTSSPLFGCLVKYCGFYNADDGSEDMIIEMRKAAEEGFSIMVFPEGTRSADGEIHRFHKGAFKLAETLQLDITPILIYGNGHIVSKRQPLHIKTGMIVNKVLPTIAHNDASFGSDYRERAKKIQKLMRSEFDILRAEYDTVKNPYYYSELIRNYTYKDPQLEWYMRIKVKLENCYEFFDNLINREARITDIGCGYGPLALMLGMRSAKRDIVGIDYDADKIALAANSYIIRRIADLGGNVRFEYANALEAELPTSDVFILNDMLHYLPYDKQEILLQNCLTKMSEGGMIVMRDGDTDNEKHSTTRLTEYFSTEFFRFNKTDGKLHFLSTSRVKAFAQKHNLSVEIHCLEHNTSNTIYILRRE